MPALIVGISLAVTQTKGYGSDKSYVFDLDILHLVDYVFVIINFRKIVRILIE